MKRIEAGVAGGPKAGEGLRIGTVASLTGLSPDTIRAWERRYGMIEPGRSEGGARLYRDEDVERLQLVKAVTECGQPLATAARMSDEEIRERLRSLAGLGEATPPLAHAPDLPLRVALVAPGLAAPLRTVAAGWTDLEVACAVGNVASLAAALPDADADVAVLELDALGAQPLAAVERARKASGASLVLVLHHFTKRSVLAQLGRAGVRLLRGPASLADVRRRILDGVTIAAATERWAEVPEPAGGPAPARIFSDAQLARLREMPSTVECECPAHLSSLVSSLAAFEAYSEGCESRSEADAALHRRLAIETGRARARMERMLLRVCEHDGIEP